MSEPDGRFSCRAGLAAWRSDPSFVFAERYGTFSGPLAELARDPAAARLVEGVVVRIQRGDPPAAIRAWASAFARRRGISLPVGFPRSP